MWTYFVVSIGILGACVLIYWGFKTPKSSEKEESVNIPLTTAQLALVGAIFAKYRVHMSSALEAQLSKSVDKTRAAHSTADIAELMLKEIEAIPVSLHDTDSYHQRYRMALIEARKVIKGSPL